MKIRTLIVDDEPLARRRLNSLLSKADFVEVIGECKNGREAKQNIQDKKPDLVFLDVQMPDFNGFEVLKNEAITDPPFIIFVTAFDEYALKAFDVNAIDYLLKPYDEERFFQALTHAQKRIEEKTQSRLHNQLQQISEKHHHQRETGKNIIEVQYRGRAFTIRTEDIYWIEADGNYLRLHVEDKKYLIRQTMQSMQDMLDSRLFLRIHRSLIVNALFVEDTRYEGNNQYAFLMKNETSLVSGRSFKEAVKAFLEGL